MWYKDEAIRYISEMNDVDKLRSVYTAAKYLNQADATKSKPEIKTDIDKITLKEILHTLFDTDEVFTDISLSIQKGLASYETLAEESGLWDLELTDERALTMKENHDRLSALHIITHDELIFLEESVASVRKTLDDLYENIKQATPTTTEPDMKVKIDGTPIN